MLGPLIAWHWGFTSFPSPVNMHLSPSSIAFTFILYSAFLFPWAIPLSDDSGVLYRFHPVSDNEIEELLSWAEVRLAFVTPGKSSSVFNFILLQLRGWDLWRTSRSHVDVYFPHPDVAETELARLPFRLPPGTSHRIERGIRDTSSRSHAHAPSAPADVVAGEARVVRWDVVSPSNATFHEQYHPLGEIESFVRDLAAAYPRQVSIVPLGHSGEGREMIALEITAAGSSDESTAGASFSAVAPHGGHVSRDQNTQVVLGKKKKNGSKSGAHARHGFLITGAQHAREVRSSFAPFARPPLPGIYASASDKSRTE